MTPTPFSEAIFFTFLWLFMQNTPVNLTVFKNSQGAVQNSYLWCSLEK